MLSEYLFYVLALALSSGISFTLLVRLWRLRSQPGAMALFVAILSVVVWTIGYAFEIVVASYSAKLFWAKFQYLGIATVPFTMFLMALQFTGRRKWIIPRRMALLIVMPLITIILVFTNDAHLLIWRQVVVPPNRLLTPLEVTHGWAFWLHVLYSYSLLAITTYMLIQFAIAARSTFRTQAIVTLVGMAFPWVANLLYVIKSPLVQAVDITPIAFTITTISFMVGISRFHLIDILPVAHTTIINALQDPVVVLDRQERVVEFNTAAGRAFAANEKWIGTPITDRLPRYLEWVDDTRIGVPTQKETWFADRCLMVRSAPVEDRRGKLAGRVLIFSDITEQKKAMQQISLQVTAMEAASNGIVITDTGGVIRYVNRAFTELTGFTREDVVGQNPRVLKSGEHPREMYTEMWTAIQSGHVWRGEMINRRKDGSLYYEEMSITPLIEDGKVANFIAIKQDVTQRKHDEQELREANQMKTRLLASVSHDMRSPLGAILGYVEMMKGGVYGPINDDQLEVLGQIIESSQQLLLFINNMIGQAQVETGRVVIRYDAFDPCDLTEAALAMGTIQAKRKGLALICRVDPNVPRTIIGDSYWLQHIVQNLVGNAIKFTDTGKIEMLIHQPEPNQWAITVSDTGVGIAPEAQAYIFEPFKQVEGPGRKSGSGLGLSIVKELTTLMGGQIELRSETGGGSQFTIRFPLRDK